MANGEKRGERKEDVQVWHPEIQSKYPGLETVSGLVSETFLITQTETKPDETKILHGAEYVRFLLPKGKDAAISRGMLDGVLDAVVAAGENETLGLLEVRNIVNAGIATRERNGATGLMGLTVPRDPIKASQVELGKIALSLAGGDPDKARELMERLQEAQESESE